MYNIGTVLEKNVLKIAHKCVIRGWQQTEKWDYLVVNFTTAGFF